MQKWEPTKTDAREMERGLQLLEEYESRDNSNEVDTAVGASNCFKEATRSLKRGCQSLSLSEKAKLEYAIRLSNCEIVTASIVPPAYCDMDSLSSQLDKCIE
jgi:hypothetical protein